MRRGPPPEPPGCGGGRCSSKAQREGRVRPGRAPFGHPEAFLAPESSTGLRRTWCDQLRPGTGHRETHLTGLSCVEMTVQSSGPRCTREDVAVAGVPLPCALSAHTCRQATSLPAAAQGTRGWHTGRPGSALSSPVHAEAATGSDPRKPWLPVGAQPRRGQLVSDVFGSWPRTCGTQTELQAPGPGWLLGALGSKVVDGGSLSSQASKTGSNLSVHPGDGAWHPRCICIQDPVAWVTVHWLATSHTHSRGEVLRARPQGDKDAGSSAGVGTLPRSPGHS